MLDSIFLVAPVLKFKFLILNFDFSNYFKKWNEMYILENEQQSLSDMNIAFYFHWITEFCTA